jgi:hypothetical protein
MKNIREKETSNFIVFVGFWVTLKPNLEISYKFKSSKSKEGLIKLKFLRVFKVLNSIVS